MVHEQVASVRVSHNILASAESTLDSSSLAPRLRGLIDYELRGRGGHCIILDAGKALKGSLLIDLKFAVQFRKNPVAGSDIYILSYEPLSTVRAISSPLVGCGYFLF